MQQNVQNIIKSTKEQKTKQSKVHRKPIVTRQCLERKIEQLSSTKITEKKPKKSKLNATTTTTATTTATPATTTTTKPNSCTD